MRIGYCCKYITSIDQINGIKPHHDSYPYNISTTTITHLNKLTQHDAVAKLHQLSFDNIASVKRLVTLVSKDRPEFRMLRLGSDILPAYTHTNWKWFYQQPEIMTLLQRQFSEIGDIARANDVRLSFHPGQFCVLGSHRDEVVENSIEEFEYHADMARYMGYGRTFQDMKINIHISGKRGPTGMREVYSRLSPEARNTITVENEEFSWGVEDCLELSDIIPTVFDIHHHWINTGNYATPDTDMIKRVIDSWRGVRPAMHYSQSKDDLIQESINNTSLPELSQLLLAGHTKSKLRAHSDFYTNKAVNQLVKEFSNYFDIQLEAKAKNLARNQLFKEWAD
jgi:UV damage endonuclease UvdE